MGAPLITAGGGTRPTVIFALAATQSFPRPLPWVPAVQKVTATNAPEPAFSVARHASRLRSSGEARHVPLSVEPAPRPRSSRWTWFVADPDEERPRILSEQGNPAHRLRVEHDADTLLVHLSDEDGGGWTVLAVDRATRRWAVAQARRQLEAAEDTYSRLYADA